MKGFLVNSGEYDERRAVAAFTSEQSARAFASGLDVADIEEIELDPPIPHKVPEGRGAYMVALKSDSGELAKYYRMAGPGKFAPRYSWRLDSVFFQAVVEASGYPDALAKTQKLFEKLKLEGLAVPGHGVIENESD